MVEVMNIFAKKIKNTRLPKAYSNIPRINMNAREK